MKAGRKKIDPAKVKKNVAVYITQQKIDEHGGIDSLKEKINFFIDPLNGQMYSHNDVEAYFKRISVPAVPSYFRQLNNRRIIQYLLEELSKCFDNDRNRYKMEELLLLANLLDQ